MDYRPIDLRNPINRQHPLARGLVARWVCLPGWMGGNTWLDLMGLNHGTLTQMGVNCGWRGTTRPGGFGHMLYDGVTMLERVAVPAIATGTNFTIAAWCNVLAFNNGSFGTILTNSAGNVGLFLNLFGGSNYLDWFSGASFRSATTFALNTWDHFAVTVAGSAVSFYVNGQAAGTDTHGASFTTNCIGGDPQGDRCNMQQDDVCLYSRVLSANEMYATYTDSLTGRYAAFNRVRAAA
jgi:hypothetical protein